MLGYNEMYNIVGGVWITFNNRNSTSRLLSVNHSKKKRDSTEPLFPTNKYSSWTRDNFILANLYINLIHSPASFMKAIEILRDLDEKEVFKFKNELINYNKFLSEDLNRLVIEGIEISSESIMEEYRNNKIKWFTFYFFMMYFGDLDKYEKSRVNGYLIRKIKKLIMFVTFSQKSMSKVKTLINDNIQF